MKNVLLVVLLMCSFVSFSQIESDASNITIECGEDNAIQDWLNSNGGATASTNCGTVTWSNDFTGITGLCSEEIIVTFTASNSCSNFQTQAALTIQDTQAPTITSFPYDITLECGSDETLPELVAEDNCSSNITITFSENTIDGSCNGEETIMRTWTVSDDCGNITTHLQTISFADYTPPSIITSASDESVSCDGSGNVSDLNNWLSSNGGAVASDTCSDVSWSNDFTVLDSDCSETVSATVTFLATDDCGNASSTTATFTIDTILNECPTTPITFTSQAEVDAFAVNYPNCTELNGSLTISGDDIVDLTPLLAITRIEGLNISNNSMLSSLNGLESITVYDDTGFNGLTISDNAVLTDISSLMNMEDITSLETSVDPIWYDTTISITSNPSLISLNGLQGFQDNLYVVYINNNNSLSDLTGLNNITGIGNDDFYIENNDNLINLNGLDSYNGHELIFRNNNSLQSLTGVPSFFSGYIALVDNDNLINLQGLEVVTSLYGLFLENNSSLSDISAIENIQFGNESGYSTIRIINNPNLLACAYSSICAIISNCDFPFCDIEIENNAPNCNSIAEVALQCGIIPSNDECEDAIELVLNDVAFETYNAFMTQSPQIPSCNDSANRIDVWFSFTTGDEGIFDIVVEGGGFNLQVWEGDCGSLTQVVDACGVNQLLDANVAFNTDYYLQVWSDGTNRATGLFDIAVYNTTLSVEDNEFSDFELYPNPVNSIVNFKANNSVENITVYNALGQNVMTVTPKVSQGVLDVSQLSNGLYFIKVHVNNKVSTFKVLKN